MRVLVGLLAAGLLAAGCTSGDDTPAHASPPTSVRAVVLPGCPGEAVQSTSPTALPDLELPCLGGGNEVPLRRLTGRPTVLNLWASWCPPCKEELPAFSRLSAAARGKLQVVGVASKDIPDRSIEYVADSKMTFPSLQDESGTLLRALHRTGLPATVLLTADGSVAGVYQGPPLTDTTLRALVRDKLGVDV